MLDHVYGGQEYFNLLQIGPVVIETWRIEYSNFVAPVNNTLVWSISFFVTETHPCALISTKLKIKMSTLPIIHVVNGDSNKTVQVIVIGIIACSILIFILIEVSME